MKSRLGTPNPLILRDLFSSADPSTIAWEKFREGIEIHRLHAGDNGSSSAFLRYAAGARLDRHVHCGYEHILVLSGSQSDDSGNHPAGTLLVHPPGSSHSITSPDGCVVLAIWEKGVTFTEQASGKSEIRNPKSE